MIYIDLETTGFDGKKDDIIEIYLLKEDENEKFISELHYYLKPNCKLSPIILEITKLTDQFLSDKPEFNSIAQEIIDFIGDEILIGHNIDSFDYKFLNNNLTKNGFKALRNKTIDTIVLARKIDNASKYTSGYKLKDLCLRYQVEFDNNKLHGAKYDVLLTKKLYQKIR